MDKSNIAQWLLYGLLILGICGDLIAIKDTVLESAFNVMQIAVATGAGILALNKRGVDKILWVFTHAPSLVFLSGQLLIPLFFHAQTIEEWLRLIAYSTSHIMIFICCGLLFVNDRQRALSLFAFIAIGTAVLLIPCVWGALGNDTFLGLELSNKERNYYFGFIASGGILSHSLTMATQCVVGLCCVLYLYHGTGNRRWLPLILVYAVGLFFTNGRAAMLQFATVAIMVYFGNQIKGGKYALSLFGVILVATSVVAFLPKVESTDSLRSMLRIDERDSKRFAAWHYAYPEIQDSPWTGHGYGAASNFTGDHYWIEALHYFKYAGFHNKLIDLAFDFGIIVAALYAIILFSEIVYAWIAYMTNGNGMYLVSVATMCFCLVVPLSVPYSLGGVRYTSISITLLMAISHAMFFSTITQKDKYQTR